MPIHFTALATETVRRLQAGGADANHMAPERHIAQGSGNPCRHCLSMIPEGAPMLVLAHRPFPVMQPYAECGPIFLCAEDCHQGGGADLPAMLASPDYIIRGYGHDDRIVYGTGAVVPTDRLIAEAEARLDDPRIAYLHVRSARNNCYQCRIDRA
ncbi:DUF1203 domain-containing protein [Gemmobacter sp. LW-1]|jgi:hypothetical protein|uniref:DUF1203 domain-containing protein n=1 Tax=Gemmobacter sp. LW-1 TaxID=1529005 RepID=UPI0006C74D91|nr:DUF1203 domain-containing protein [Gemmobacter sp. LW-1]